MTKARKTNLFFLWMIVFYIMGCFFFIPLIPDKYYTNYLGIVLGQSLILIPLIVYLIATKGAPLKELKFRRIGVLNTILLIVFTYCLVPVVTFINLITMMFTTNEVAGQLDSMSNNRFWFNIFMTALLPAVMEELVFRGVIYSGYRNSTIKRAMLTSALVFGLFHMNINQFCYAFFMGMVFVLVREATGSMHSSMIMHFIFNANSVVLLKILDIVKNYANRMAENNEQFRELSDSLNQEVSSSGATYANIPVIQKIYMLMSYGIIAVIAGVIAFFVFKTIAQRCHRSRHVSLIIGSITGAKTDNKIIQREDEYIESNGEGYGGRIIDFVFILAIVICILMMIYR